MDFDIYFPLFNEILHGNLNPERKENAITKNYSVRLQEQIVGCLQPMGAYSLQYLKPTNNKCSYYLRMLLSETNGYCLDVLTYLHTETDYRIRTYLCDQILEKHLTTCFMRLGEKLNAENYRLDELRKPAVGANLDRLSNIYIFHLLKVCLAKAYLEVQEQLRDVVVWRHSEELLYNSFVMDLAPVPTFLKKRKQPIPLKLNKEKIPDSANNEGGNSTVANAKYKENEETVVPKIMDSKQVCELFKISESTLGRYKKRDDFPKAIKMGKKDMYDEKTMLAYYQFLLEQ